LKKFNSKYDVLFLKNSFIEYFDLPCILPNTLFLMLTYKLIPEK